MQKVTEAESKMLNDLILDQIQPRSEVLRTLIAEEPNVWFHIPLNEAPGRNLPDQVGKLEAEADEAGYQIRTQVLPGDPRGGFYTILIRYATA